MEIIITIPPDWAFSNLRLRFESATERMYFEADALEPLMDAKAFRWLIEEAPADFGMQIITDIWEMLDRPEDTAFESFLSHVEAKTWNEEQVLEDMGSQMQSNMRRGLADRAGDKVAEEIMSAITFGPLMKVQSTPLFSGNDVHE